METSHDRRSDRLPLDIIAAAPKVLLHDHLDGGPGNDRLLGGPGADILIGGDDEDDAHGGKGIDACGAEAVAACEGAV